MISTVLVFSFSKQLDRIHMKNIAMFIMFVNQVQIICVNVHINYFGIIFNRNVNGQIRCVAQVEH